MARLCRHARDAGSIPRSLTVPCAIAAGVAILLGCDAPFIEPRPSPPDVVLISIDSLRADHTTPYGYRPRFTDEPTTPFLAWLASEGVLFENASADSSWTLPSHVSLLTGMHSSEHGVRSGEERIADGTEHIAGLLRKQGYATAGFYSGPFLHQDWGFAQGFDLYKAAVPYLQGLDARHAVVEPSRLEINELHDESHRDARCGERVVDSALDWLDSRVNAPSDTGERPPFFVFLHLWDPHYDYAPPLSYVDRFVPRNRRGNALRWADVRQDEIEEALAFYDAEIRYTDDQISRFFTELQRRDLTRPLVFAVTSDHGEEFFEHGLKGHQRTLYQEVMHIPLILYAPSRLPAGLRISGSVGLVDVAPTLLELAGAKPWSSRSGRSLLPMLRAPSRADSGHPVLMDLGIPGRPLLSGWRSGSRKVIVDRESGEARVFDLATDPGESRPIEDAIALAKAQSRTAEVARATVPTQPIIKNLELEAQLRALGYLSN